MSRRIAAFLQLLTIVPFALGTIIVMFFGQGAQKAAEAEMVRQGHAASTLADNGISFAGSDGLAIVIMIVLAALAALNLAGKRAGRVGSWILHPILLVMGVLIIPSQIFTAAFITLPGVDANALVEAAKAALPGWATAASWAKLVLTTAGSVAVVALLATRSARATTSR
ncbi:hypothetical protein [Nonomuraea typhae]|uniref:hypothetical protein n=1 Tax=Nonomuraea typhae TaxID=2603600 RepID=UPI0012FA06C2|nr:hypothetical protein [Nonomuraea typhae]